MACTSGCSGTCSSVCSGSCGGSCTSSCGSSCGDSCKGTCLGGCSTECTGVCQNDCSGTCRDGCQGSCIGSCVAGCSDTCTYSCSGTAAAASGSGSTGITKPTNPGSSTGSSNTDKPSTGGNTGNSGNNNVPDPPIVPPDESQNNHFPNGHGMNPATWRQVRTNMDRVIAIAKLLNEYDMWDILGDDYPDLAALIREMLKMLDDLFDRLGTITALVNNVTVNNPPADYKYDITYEFKDPKKIGLGDKPGFVDLTHCLLQTVITASIEGDTNFQPYQLAIGRDMCQYYRYETVSPNGSKIWGPWKKIQYGTQWLLSDVFPEDDVQEVGDYLVMPV